MSRHVRDHETGSTTVAFHGKKWLSCLHGTSSSIVGHHAATASGTRLMSLQMFICIVAETYSRMARFVAGCTRPQARLVPESSQRVEYNTKERRDSASTKPTRTLALHVDILGPPGTFAAPFPPSFSTDLPFCVSMYPFEYKCVPVPMYLVLLQFSNKSKIV